MLCLVGAPEVWQCNSQACRRHPDVQRQQMATKHDCYISERRYNILWRQDNDEIRQDKHKTRQDKAMQHKTRQTQTTVTSCNSDDGNSNSGNPSFRLKPLPVHLHSFISKNLLVSRETNVPMWRFEAFGIMLNWYRIILSVCHFFRHMGDVFFCSARGVAQRRRDKFERGLLWNPILQFHLFFSLFSSCLASLVWLIVRLNTTSYVFDGSNISISYLWV